MYRHVHSYKSERLENFLWETLIGNTDWRGESMCVMINIGPTTMESNIRQGGSNERKYLWEYMKIKMCTSIAVCNYFFQEVVKSDTMCTCKIFGLSGSVENSITRYM